MIIPWDLVVIDEAHRLRNVYRPDNRISADFQVLWDKIKHRTRYRVTFDTPDLIERALVRIKDIEPIRAPCVATTVVEVDISDAGVSADRQVATRVREAEPVNVLPDILAFLQKETDAGPRKTKR